MMRGEAINRSRPSRRGTIRELKQKKKMPPPLLLPAAGAAAAAAAAPPSAAISRRPASSRIRAPQPLFAFARLRKYDRRDREPVIASFNDEEEEEEEEDDDDDVEDEVEEDAFLEKAPKPVGFGVGKTYSTDIEERLLREMGSGGARRGREAVPAMHRAAANSPKQTSADLTNDSIHVRLWNLPKKKNIHKDLQLAFKGFPGLRTINPAVSANKKTRDPICKGFAYLELESVEAATRFTEIYSGKTMSFGKIQKPVKCCIIDRDSSVDPSNQASSSQAICQLGLNPQNLVAAS